MIVITGAAGMIGSGVVRELNNQGKSSLVLVDDLKQSPEKWKNLVGKQFVDLFSKHKLFEWLQGRHSEIDAIIHLGACSSTTETDADYLLENNFHFTVRLAEWALTHDKRFIYASSAATYGDGSRGFSDDEEAIEELRPLNMYGFSKQLVDLWMKRENVFHKVVGLKYFNVFGPNEYHKGSMASMPFKMAHLARRGESVGLYQSNDPVRFADGEQCRDFIYVKDAVRMTCAFLEKRDASGLFNIGSGSRVTWNRLAQALFQALELPPKIHYVGMPPELNAQYQNDTCAVMDKFCTIFSLETRPIEPAVLDYMANYLMKNGRW